LLSGSRETIQVDQDFDRSSDKDRNAQNTPGMQMEDVQSERGPLRGPPPNAQKSRTYRQKPISSVPNTTPDAAPAHRPPRTTQTATIQSSNSQKGKPQSPRVQAAASSSWTSGFMQFLPGLGQQQSHTNQLDENEYQAQIETQIRSLTEDKESLIQDITQANSQLDKATRSLQSMRNQNKDLDRRYRDLRAKTNDLEISNRELRSAIYAKGMNHNPQYADQHYSSAFGELTFSIENRLVGFAFKNTGQSMSDQAIAEILGSVRQLGSHGEKAAQYLTNSTFSLSVLYDESRALLVRHIAALFLLHRIFEPFALGIAPELAEILRSIEDDPKCRGKSPKHRISNRNFRIA
jgi:hypothetical protein